MERQGDRRDDPSRESSRRDASKVPSAPAAAPAPPVKKNIHPVKEACDHVVKELRSLFIKDIKERASAPAIYEYLHPNRFKDLKKKTEPQAQAPKLVEEATTTTEISLAEIKEVKKTNIPALPRFKKRTSLGSVAVKPKTKATKKLMRPMNHRLNYSSSDEESEEESSQRSTPAAVSTAVEKAKPEDRKRTLHERTFDYTSSEEDEEELVVKKLKLSRRDAVEPETKPVKEEQPTEALPPKTEPETKDVPTLTPTKHESDSESSEEEEEEEKEESIIGKIWRPAHHEPCLEIIKPTLSWDISTTGPEPVCEDNMDAVLDLDGFQTFVKDKEDWALIKEVLGSTEPEHIEHPGFWSWNKKETKSINNGGHIGPIAFNTDLDEKRRWMSGTGASRSEGYFKIPEADKAAYLPHRKKIHQPIDTIQFEGTKNNQTAALSSRMNRVNNRRMDKDVSLQKQMLGSETDILRFNQLKKRKKPVKFARSAIHNWGLYAIEPIAANEMIIEYVGEIIRQKVSERREKNYLRSGLGSSYLFRIDENTVIDATKRGGIARFINHCCTPSCTAKIIKVEGQKRIVIYALRDIAADEELTYDYKFEREQDGGERIPCLCGAPGCKGFLN